MSYFNKTSAHTCMNNYRVPQINGVLCPEQAVDDIEVLESWINELKGSLNYHYAQMEKLGYNKPDDFDRHTVHQHEYGKNYPDMRNTTNGYITV